MNVIRLEESRWFWLVESRRLPHGALSQRVKGEVKRTRFVVCWSALVLWLVAGSGCSIASLKDANKRLKESNDRLISENNRLEEELSALQRKLGDRGADAVESAPFVASDPGKPAGKAKGSRDSSILDGLDDEVEVFETKQGIRMRIPDRVFFSLGQATLSARGQRILDKVAKVINGHSGHMVRVDGHTDDTPIRKVRHLYPTNWELSSARACTVVRYLVDRGNVSARRIYPAGFAYFRPVASGRTSTSRSENRRVEITILNESV